MRARGVSWRNVYRVSFFAGSWSKQKAHLSEKIRIKRRIVRLERPNQNCLSIAQDWRSSTGRITQVWERTDGDAS